MNTLGLTAEIQGQNGYSLNLKLSPTELTTIQQMIRVQWLYRLQLLVPDQVHQFDQIGIERYHELAHLVDHAEVWPKTTRVFPREAISLIKKMDFFKRLTNEVGDFVISDEENFGWENIYWRLVRPGNADFGSLHQDKWFWEIGEYGKVPDYPHERLKIWIAIHTVTGKNGLRVMPGSHQKKDWKWHAELRNGSKKPIFDEAEANLNIQLLSTAPGHAVVFHDELIHGGAENTADTTRVSIEFTLLVPTRQQKKALSRTLVAESS